MLVMDNMFWAFMRQPLRRRVLIIAAVFGLLMLITCAMAYAANPPNFHPEGGGPGSAEATNAINWGLWWAQVLIIAVGIGMLIMIPVAVFTDHDRSPFVYVIGLLLAGFVFRQIQDPGAFMNGISAKLGNG